MICPMKFPLWSRLIFPQLQSEDDFYLCEIDSYVTYMDEEILSVVFKESVHMSVMDDYLSIFDYYCVNFDLTTGTIIENTEVLRLDEDFAIDFRQREIAENGDEALTDFTDQEILEMLKNPEHLVLFYTPMGLEVGLNLEDIIVYVMYADYGQYLNSF